jgi:hypothetical protein
MRRSLGNWRMAVKMSSKSQLSFSNCSKASSTADAWLLTMVTTDDSV